MAQISLIQFHVTNFYAVLMNRVPFSPTYMTLWSLARALVNAEQTQDPESRKKLEWIYKNTHEKVEIPLPTIELAVFRNIEKGINRDIDITDKNFSLIELYKYLHDVAVTLSDMVDEIAKKYNIDIPFNFQSRPTSLQL